MLQAVHGWSSTYERLVKSQKFFSSYLTQEDMSRFGRNYLEVGFYTEIQFPSKGVRFIAINNNVDSANPTDNDFTPFLNIMNEWYAKDTSNKIRAVFKSRMQDGKRCSGSIPYGYKRVPGDKQTLHIDAEAAAVVRRIFDMAASGASLAQIGQTLSDEKVLIPSAYEERYHPESARHHSYHDPYRWNTTTLTYILNRQEYLGHTVLCKSIRENFKLKKRRAATPEERIIFKNTHEAIHCNEIVLLAYYIAAVNIEETYHELSQSEDYVPFEGIVLTDTFELAERSGTREGEADTSIFQPNSDRAVKQIQTPIQVIIGNPPYSVGQKSGNDNNQNVSYPNLDKAVMDTYAAQSGATLRRSLYDSYIKAFRWATDRIEENGIIGFVTNGQFIDASTLCGLRKSLVSEFNSIYCFNLRGDQRTQGELSRKEGGKIFGSGSRTPVAITILLKKKGVKKDGFVRHYDIGDYLTRQQKLDKVKEFDNVSQIGWKIITPDINGDWVNLRNPQYMNFFPIGERRKESEISYFSDNFSTGMVTSRDAWLYSFDYKSNNAESMISFFNQEQQRCELLFEKMLGENKLSKNQRAKEAFFENNRSVDSHKISWSRGLLNAFCKGEPLSYKGSRKIVMHRPFCKEWCFVAPKVIESPSKWERIFPEEDSTNYVIAIPGKSKRRFSALITSVIQDYDMEQHANAFPLYIYEKETIKDDGQLSLFGESEKRTTKWNKRYALSDMILHKYRELYGNKVTKEDIFFYIYAVLQTPSFVDGYADDLSKGVTRIPTLAHFVDYVRIGRELADLHLKYEKPVSAEELGVTIEMHKEDYTVVDRMRFGKGKDKSIIEYNPYITIRNIPTKAYDYIVNGKSAIEWIVEQYAVTTDKASGIVNDPNTYAGGKYIFDLLLSIISVSLKTQELIAQLPEYKEI